MATFNFTFEEGVTFNQALSFEMAGQIWSHYLQDDISLNIQVASTDALPERTLGGAYLNTQSIDADSVEQSLALDATSSDDLRAVESIGQDGKFEGLLEGEEAEGQYLNLSQAQIKALGIDEEPLDATDGYIIFNSLAQSDVSWDYGLDRTAPQNENSVDHLSIALHEIGHILGFISGLDNPNYALEDTTLLDLFRYSPRSTELGINEFTPGEQAFFSIDGGNTELAPFSTGITEIDPFTEEGYQASHWGQATQNTNDSILGGFIGSIPIANLYDSFGGLATPLIPNVVLTGVREVVVSTAEQTQNIAKSIFDLSFSTQLADEDDGNNLGILDPTLAIGERSSISELDLIAFDVLGYDTIEDRGNPLDYQQLLSAAKERVANLSGLTSAELENAIAQNSLLPLSSTSQDDDDDDELEGENIYERRRRRQRVRQSAYFWGELDQSETLSAYSTNGQSSSTAEDYLNIGGNSSLDNDETSDQNGASYDLVTGHSDDIIQVSAGTQSVSSGKGNDWIILGNFQEVFLAQDGNDDFVTIRDWDESDHLLLHGNIENYNLQGQDLYYQDDLIARFEGGLNFDLNYTLGQKSDAYYLGSEHEDDSALNGLFYDNFAFSENQNLWLFDTSTQAALRHSSQGDNFLPSIFSDILEEPAETDVLIQALIGGQKNDIILGHDASEKLKGRRGNDNLVGGAGNDTLFGQAGDDVLNGTNSQARGVGETDVLYGGKGQDLFVLADEFSPYYIQNRSADQAIIKHFNQAEDTIRLTGSASDYRLRSPNKHTILTYEGDRIAILRNVTVTTFESFEFI